MTDAGATGFARKRLIRRLAGAPDQLDGVLKKCRESWSVIRPEGGGPTVRLLVGHLGSLDREVFHAAARRIVAGETVAESAVAVATCALDGDVELRELAELAARFRHFRAQAVHALDRIPEDLWEGAAPDPGVLNLPTLLARWCDSDERELFRIESAIAHCGGLSDADALPRVAT